MSDATDTAEGLRKAARRVFWEARKLEEANAAPVNELADVFDLIGRSFFDFRKEHQTTDAVPLVPASVSDEWRRKARYDQCWNAFYTGRARSFLAAAELLEALAKTKPRERERVIEEWKRSVFDWADSEVEANRRRIRDELLEQQIYEANARLTRQALARMGGAWRSFATLLQMWRAASARPVRTLQAAQAFTGRPPGTHQTLRKDEFRERIEGFSCTFAQRFARARFEASMRQELRDKINSDARKRLHSGDAETWPAAVSAADQAFRCGAKAKSTGKPCQAQPVPGQRRCRVHGGIWKPITEEGRIFLREKAAKQPRLRGRWAKAEPAE